jgi:uncharacterized repeat protein (TIGR01451 family)
LVANANSADVAIVKTATPNPVSQGDTLTYRLAVSNNGPASATNVTVLDTLPTEVTYLSVTTNTGTCSEAGGTVTCLLGTMANGGTAAITVLTLAGVPGVVSNTATVSADQTDPTPGNNSSTQMETIAAPTGIQLQAFAAWRSTDKNGADRVVLTWKTGGEANNLGFHVYRELNGNRVRLNPSLIAGSALWMSGALPKHAGRSYHWIDRSPSDRTSSDRSSSTKGSDGGAAYWLEDVDVNGTRTMHGPVLVQGAVEASSGDDAAAQSSAARSLMLNQLNRAQPAQGPGSHGVETLPGVPSAPTASQIQKQFELAAHPAVKILVRHEGWYSVGQPDLLKAGLDPSVDPATLQLFAEAIEQPIQITGATGGPGGFGAQAAINFYGTGIDTEYSGTRVYWLVAGNAGKRIPQLQSSSGANQPAASFPYTVEVQPRTIYFAALITADGNNFFGPLVSTTPLEETMKTPSLDASSSQPVLLEVVLQGIIRGVPHDVTVALNGTALGDVTFSGQKRGLFHVNVPPGVLQAGSNTMTLAAQNGEYDTSLVSDVKITYPHLYTADSDQLKFTGRAGDEVMVGGFTNGRITVLDITDPLKPVQVPPQIVSSDGTYTFAVQVPWTTTSTGRAARHTLLAVAADGVAAAVGVRANHPSAWHSMQSGAEVAMVTHENFMSALPPLVAAHSAAGKSSVVVPVGDLYDEFNFGERSPYAIRQFLQSAIHAWKIKPKYLLLNGRASLDPRNYLGFGNLDFVPTKIVASSGLMTATDDWFSDFQDTGMPTLATGRLPVSTLEEANTVVGKIAAYEGQSTNGPWTGAALMVADRDDSSDNFTQDSQTVQSEMPSTLQLTDIFAGTVEVTAARQQIVSAINSGQLLVNYLGHGAEAQWSGEDILDNNAVATLTNGSQLPVFFIMDCLNGFFQDVYDQPLAVTLMLAPNGGGVAVLASSGLNLAPPQAKLDALVVKSALSSSRPTLGDAILSAKSQINNAMVRKTYILFGDPAMQVKQPGAN